MGDTQASKRGANDDSLMYSGRHNAKAQRFVLWAMLTVVNDVIEVVLLEMKGMARIVTKHCRLDIS